jgi:superfamily II DNA/RNA helicase
LKHFHEAKKILFTATPFRRDKKEIKGKFIYNYAISDAYKDGVFGKIEYIPVDNIEVSEDIAIAKKAEQVFTEDKNAGFEHCLMVRTDRNKRAKELEKIYAENTSLRLKIINSDHSYSHVKSVIKKLNNGELDGIICVNMLGEGFNFPKLKIAAIHSPHKSLEVTLQFIGRFARTNAPNLGTAKFIATPSEIEIEREKIYEEGAVWQEIIINLSESRIDEEVENKQTLSTFNCVLNRDDETNDLSLASLVPFAHVLIYSVDTFNIDTDVVLPNGLLLVNKHISREYSMVVIIAKEILNPNGQDLICFKKYSMNYLYYIFMSIVNYYLLVQQGKLKIFMKV